MESIVGSVSDVAGSSSSRNELTGSTTECLSPPSPTGSGCSVWSVLCFCRNFRWNKSGSRTSLLKNGLPSSVCASKATLTSDCAAAAAADPDHQPCCNRSISSTPACHKQGPCCAAAAAGYSTYTTFNTPSVPPNANGVGHHMTTTTAPNGGPYGADVSQSGGVTSDCTSVITVIPRGGQPCQLTVVDNTVMSVCAVGSNGYHSNNNSNSFVTSPPATTAATADKRNSTVPVLPDEKSQDSLNCCVINGDRVSRLMNDMTSTAVTATIPPIVPSNNNSNIIDTVFHHNHHQLQQQQHPCNLPSLGAEDCYYATSDNRYPTAFPDAVSTTATTTTTNVVADCLNGFDPAVVQSVRNSTQPSNNTVDATCCQSVCNNIAVADSGSHLESGDSCTAYSPVSSAVKKAPAFLQSQTFATTAQLTLDDTPYFGADFDVDYAANQDGSFYLNVVDAEERRLNERSCNVNRLLSDCSGEIPDEAQGKICAAVGKANLLTSKKFRQFRDLCGKNLNGSVDDVLVPTVSDLTGFWEMVLIQVADVDKMFAEIDRLSSSNWVLTLDCVDGAEPSAQLAATTTTAGTTAYKSAGSKPRMPRNGQVSAPPPSKSVKADSTSDASRAREAARQRLVAAKMAGRRRKTNDPENDVEIFVS